MIKICHITSVHSQNDIRIFEKECCALAVYGYDVHLVASGISKTQNAVHIHGMGDIPKSRIQRMLCFTKRVYEKALEIDAQIYHFHDPELIPFGLRLKKLGYKVIFDSHENVLEQFAEKTYIPLIIRKVVNSLFIHYLEWACSQFDAIVSVDPYICDRYKKLNEHVVMVANFPRIEDSKCVQRKPQNKYIAFAGGIDAQWNHDIIIKAIENVDDIQYVLCGRANEEYLSYLKTLPGWKRVDFRGEVSHEEALEILRGSIAGVALCSYSKNTNGIIGTLGNTKLFEIMMCGVPVICTNFEQWKEIVLHYQCGFVLHYHDNMELEKIIKQLLSDPEASANMGLNGMNAVHKYSWESQETNLKRMYDELTVNL